MDTVLKFPGPGRASCLQGIHADITKRLALRSLSLKRTCNFDSDKTGLRQNAVAFKRKTPHKSWNSGSISAMASKRDSKFSSNSFSISQKVEYFYACINEKNIQKLDESISSDAYFDDFTFSKPFQGKKEIMNFLKQLIASMGQNVKFKVVHICEGDDYTATAHWHLEWRSAQIPFTRGSTFFSCSKEGEKIIIKKAEVLIESPIKPGSIVLTLLKTVTSLFDDFPKATEWFLRSPHAVLNWIRKIYNILIAPIVNPLVEGYITFWSLGARLVGYIFSIVIFITKIFVK